MTQALTVSDISYSVAGLDILKRLSLDVEQQQYYAIAGVNGLENTDLSCGEELACLPEKCNAKKNIAGRRYLEFIAAAYRLKADADRASGLDECLDFPTDRLDARIGGYSRGMLQKLGLGSCLMLDRRLIILDEPLSGLDPRARYHSKEIDEFDHIVREYGVV